MNEVTPLARHKGARWTSKASALALMTLGGGSMYAAVLVLEPASAEFGIGRGLASLPYGSFMLGFGIALLLGSLLFRSEVKARRTSE